MKQHIRQLLKDNNNTLPACVWPGGYPILYLDRDNCVLCPKCATRSALNPDELPSSKPIAAFIHYEGGPEYCSECACSTESAYGDPNEN